MTNDPNLPPEVSAKIRATATKLLQLAMDEMGGSALYAISALLLAGGTAAAWGLLGYESLIQLVSTYHEAALLADAEKELNAAGQMAIWSKKPGGVH